MGLYLFKSKDTKVHTISANNLEQAEREFIRNYVIKNKLKKVV